MTVDYSATLGRELCHSWLIYLAISGNSEGICEMASLGTDPKCARSCVTIAGS